MRKLRPGKSKGGRPFRQPPRKYFRKLSAVAAAAAARLFGNDIHRLAAADHFTVLASAALRHLELDAALTADKLVPCLDWLHFIPFRFRNPIELCSGPDSPHPCKNNIPLL